MKKTIELSRDEISAAIAEYLSRHHNVTIKQITVNDAINGNEIIKMEAIVDIRGDN